MTDPHAHEGRQAYRHDIDGLRAVAVLLVVFDHLRTRVRGGYVGVDVFFVISGYLISSHILSEMDRGQFSIVTFYERRIRRIFPALLVMLLVTSGLAWRYLLPMEAVSFARSLIAAVLSYSNFFFWGEAGYFDAPSSLKPLLHTWSLAVEEQFYLMFPLMIMAVRRWLPAWLKRVIFTATALSFALACFWVQRKQSTAFFFSPLRAWELLIGTVLSQKFLPPIVTKAGRNVVAMAGLLLILVPALLYSAQTPFPGLAAVPPCVGAALLIAAGETGGSWVGAALAWRPVAFFGLISYSLYLWHWPLIVFRGRALVLPDVYDMSPRVKATLFVISVIVATISWRFVETPFRKGAWKPGRTTLFALSGATVAVVLAFGAWTLATHGLPLRFSPEAVRVAAYESYRPGEAWREGTCFVTPESGFGKFDPATCMADVPGKPTMLLLGDSLAAQLYPGLKQTFPEINFTQVNSADCRPLLVAPTYYPFADYYPDCKRMDGYVYGEFLPSHPVDTVLLAASWHEMDMPGLGETIDWIKQHGMKVIVLGPVPAYDTTLPRLLALSMREHNMAAVTRRQMREQETMDRHMAILARKKWQVGYISAFDDLCRSQVEMVAQAQPESTTECPLFAAPGVPMEFDDHHLTIEASLIYAQAMRAKNQLALR